MSANIQSIQNLSFTDEQLLNLVNNTIIRFTEFNPDNFTGGNVTATLSRNKKEINYKVYLYFGYNKSRNSQSFVRDIVEDEFYIWQKAIMVKIFSLRSINLSSNLSELNELMSNQNENIPNNTINNKVGIGIGIGTLQHDFVTKSYDNEKKQKKSSKNTDNKAIDLTKIANEDLKLHDLSLQKETYYEDTSDIYKEKLEYMINKKIAELEDKAIKKGVVPTILKYDAFIDGLLSKGYKYKNFLSAYSQWNRR